MTSSSPCPVLLPHHPCLCAHDPWLFYRPGPGSHRNHSYQDWRWVSWGEVARQIDRTLGQQRVPDSARRVAFPYWPSPYCLVLDLALQAGGWVATPVQAQDLERVLDHGHCDLVVDWPEERDTVSDSPLASLHLQRFRRPPGSRAGGRAPGKAATRGSVPGRVCVATGTGGTVLDADELVAWSHSLSAAIPPPTQREIVVSHGCLDEVAERVLLTWATLVGAAVVLEPERDALAQTVFWTRPTLLHGTPDVLRDLAASLGGVSGRAKPAASVRRALGRLRCFVLTAEGDPEPEAVEFWQQVGVRLVSLPAG